MWSDSSPYTLYCTLSSLKGVGLDTGVRLSTLTKNLICSAGAGILRGNDLRSLHFSLTLCTEGKYRSHPSLVAPGCVLGDFTAHLLECSGRSALADRQTGGRLVNRGGKEAGHLSETSACHRRLSRSPLHLISTQLLSKQSRKGANQT